MLQLQASGIDATTLSAAVHIIRSYGLHALPNYRHAGAEPVLEFIGSLPPGYAPTPGLTLRRAPEVAESPRNGVRLDASGRIAFVRIADHQDGHWHLKRIPREFKRRLNKANESTAQEIRLDAWNDFATGAYLQPDRASGRDMLSTLQ